VDASPDIVASKLSRAYPPRLQPGQLAQPARVNVYKTKDGRSSPSSCEADKLLARLCRQSSGPELTSDPASPKRDEVRENGRVVLARQRLPARNAETSGEEARGPPRPGPRVGTVQTAESPRRHPGGAKGTSRRHTGGGPSLGMVATRSHIREAAGKPAAQRQEHGRGAQPRDEPAFSSWRELGRRSPEFKESRRPYYQDTRGSAIRHTAEANPRHGPFPVPARGVLGQAGGRDAARGPQGVLSRHRLGARVSMYGRGRRSRIGRAVHRYRDRDPLVWGLGSGAENHAHVGCHTSLHRGSQTQGAGASTNTRRSSQKNWAMSFPQRTGSASETPPDRLCDTLRR